MRPRHSLVDQSHDGDELWDPTSRTCIAKSASIPAASYCLICECYPDSTVGADDPTSTDRMSLMAVEADRGRGWIADRLLIDFGFYEPCQVSQECRQPSTPHVCLAGKRRVYWWSVRPPTPKQFPNQIFLAFVAGRHAVRSSLGFVWGPHCIPLIAEALRRLRSRSPKKGARWCNSQNFKKRVRFGCSAPFQKKWRET